MKKLFTPESLEVFLEETRVRSLLKRVNYGRSFPLTMPGGGNPYAAAAILDGEVQAYLVVDGNMVRATVTARAKTRPTDGSPRVRDNSVSMPASMAASGKRKRSQKRRIEDIEFQVEVDGYRILDSTVSEEGVSSLSVNEDGTFVFDEVDTNECVASDSAKAELRVLGEGESALLPPKFAAVPDGTPTTSPGEVDDAALIHWILAGDSEAFAKLVLKYEPLVSRFVRAQVGNAEDLADITQETFLAVHQELKNFVGNSQLPTWICAIAKIQVARFVRYHYGAQKRDRRKVVSLEVSKSRDYEAGAFDPSDLSERPVDYAQRQERAAAVRDAIAQIGNDNLRKAVEMYYFQSMSYEEIAEKLRCPIGSISGWLSRAKSRLEELLCGIVGQDDNQADSMDEQIA